jgi:hypothetical protein
MSRLAARTTSWTVAVLAVALLGLGASTASSSPTKGVPFPLGWWVGKVNYAQRQQTIGKVQVTISKGALKIYALSTYDASGLSVYGDLDLNFHATGELKVNGAEATGEFDIVGTFELEGPPDAVWADGAYRMKGVVIVNGFDVPYDQVIAVSQPITVTSATCRAVKGSLPAGPGGSTPYPWTAKRQLGPPCK